MTVLERIIARKREELARAEARLPRRELTRLAEAAPAARDFAAALASGAVPRIIAEVKRASPVKGVLRADLAPLDYQAGALARAYADGGARAISVLTDVAGFWGDPDALMACKLASGLPALRKDFVLSPYQVDESRWLGADAVLLIVRVLDDATLSACAARAHELGMAVLAEVHADAELSRALALPHALIGVNHRDLGTMTMDRDRALRLLERMPAGRLMVAESGLSRRPDLARLEAAGITAFLIGEAVASAREPAAVLRELRGA